MMGPIESIKTCYQKFFTYKGRARRSEFWWFWLFCNALSAVPVVMILNAMEEMSQYYYYTPDSIITKLFFWGFLTLLISVPLFFATIRRLHDIDYSGWWLLIVFIPVIGTIVWLGLLFLEALDGTAEDNKYGPSPKYVRKASAKNEQTDNILEAKANEPQSESAEQEEAVKEVEYDEPEFDEDEEALKKEIQFCLENDGTLTAAEYKYIESVASRLGIEKERVSEIVESCKPKLSADEQRYVDFYRDIVRDPKNVDSRTRRLLDREAFANGITHERQKELENIANI